MNLSEAEFTFFQELIALRSGIEMKPRKRAVVAQRLEPLMDELGLVSFGKLIDLIKLSGNESSIYRQTIDALLTADGGLFRGFGAYRFMKQVGIPELMEIKGADKTLKIWSIGCGAGEEPYSISIALRNSVPELSKWDVEIIGTDIASSNIEKARTGLYYKKDIARGAPKELVEKNLESFGKQWSIKKEHREWVQFKTMNILRPWDDLPLFDVILMRNVLLYLDASGRDTVLAKIFNQVHPHSFIFLGPNELPPTSHPMFMSVSDQRISAYRLMPELMDSAKTKPPSTAAAEPSQGPTSTMLSGVMKLTPTNSDLLKLSKLVSDIYLFRAMPPHIIDKVCDRLELFGFGNEEALIKQGQKGEAFFILLDGKVDVIVNRSLFRKGSTLATLKAGNIFGEMSLIMDQPCNASVVASGGARAFLASRSLFEYLLAENEPFAETIQQIIMERTTDSSVKTQTKSAIKNLKRPTPSLDESGEQPSSAKPQKTSKSSEEFTQVTELSLDDRVYSQLSKLVRSIYLFKGLRAGDIDSICHRIKLYGFPPDHAILKHGEDGSSFYIVYEGHVKVTSKGSFLKKGIELALLGPGDVFGEISLILDRPCGANVIADGSMKAFRVSKNLFDYLFEENKTFAATVNAIALQRRADTAVKTQMS
jgi:chemotaxis protein methyltransferase CheR